MNSINIFIVLHTSQIITFLKFFVSAFFSINILKIIKLFAINTKSN